MGIYTDFSNASIMSKYHIYETTQGNITKGVIYEINLSYFD